MSDQNYDFDLICIGGGSGGLACAKAAKSFGARVAVIDYVKPTPKGTTWGIGGTCVNVGCIPKKLMHHAALLGAALHDATYYGWIIPDEENIILNWSKLLKQIHYNIKSTSWTIKVELRSKDISYFEGAASFIDSHSINVNTAQGPKVITGLYILIATGCRPVYPNIPGAKEYGITSDDLFFLKGPPGKTLFIGAGYISMECAGFLNELGCDTTIASRGEVLANFDRDMIQHIVDYMETRGVKFLYDRLPVSVEPTPDSERFFVKLLNTKTNIEEVHECDTVIFAMGRRPLLDDLNVQAIHLAISNGAIVVNDNDETNVPNIFALGDVAKGRTQLTPVAICAGQLLAERLFNGSTELMDYTYIPTTIFTPLEYSCVGLSEEAAKDKFGASEIEVYHAYYSPIEFIIANRCTRYCYVKIIVQRNASEAQILGLHFIGRDAGEVMQGFAVAIKCGLTMKQLVSTLGVHLTSAEELTKVHVTKRSGLDPVPPIYLS